MKFEEKRIIYPMKENGQLRREIIIISRIELAFIRLLRTFKYICLLSNLS